MVVDQTRRWIEKAVIGLNLCPFAKAVYVKEQIRYRVSTVQTQEELLEHFDDELQLLADADPTIIDTTLLIHSASLRDIYQKLRPLLTLPPDPPAKPRREIGFHTKS